jgi:hypothetical protein
MQRTEPELERNTTKRLAKESGHAFWQVLIAGHRNGPAPGKVPQQKWKGDGRVRQPGRVPKEKDGAATH